MPNPNREQSLANIEAIAKKRRSRTHCAKGHNNWFFPSKDGRRRCRTCYEERMRLGPKLLGPFGLRDIEINILQDMANGLRVDQSAIKHNYSISAIKLLRYRARQKLRARNQYHAITIALREQIIK